MNQEQAQERIEELKGYYSHLASFVSVNLFLLMINIVNWDGYLWIVYPLFGWGIGLGIHTITTFWSGADWQERKMQELTGWSVTHGELERLSERTDNLVTILSSINWEKIDPEFLVSRDNLQKARDSIDAHRGRGSVGADPVSKDQVVREIEKLEEIVTSSRFRFFDDAQSLKN